MTWISTISADGLRQSSTLWSARKAQLNSTEEQHMSNISLADYQAIAGACGQSNPAVSRAEWEQLQADAMVAMID